MRKYQGDSVACGRPMPVPSNCLYEERITSGEAERLPQLCFVVVTRLRNGEEQA